MPPGWSGAGRPEKRVTARSKLPQNRWTGLTFPTYAVRNRFSTRVDRDDRLEKTRYRVGVVGPRLPIISKRNWIGNFIRATVELRRAAKFPDQVQEVRVNSVTDIGPSGNPARRPSVVAPMAASSTRSNAISTPTAPFGILAPGALTYRVACQEWFTQGVRANRYLPTIWAYRWSAEHVSRHSS
jgi:hypothetical protein